MTSLKNKNVLITGADGFLGSALVNACLAQGAYVAALVRSLNHLKRLKPAYGLSFVVTDMADFSLSAVKDQLSGPIDIAIHAAATGIHAHQNDWPSLMAVNVKGTQHLLDLCVQAKAKRFVYIGSSFEYGDGEHWKEDAPVAPRNLYGLSKSMGWLLAKYYMDRFHLPVVGLRPFYLYGPGEAQTRLIPTVVQAMREGRSLPLTPGRQCRDFIYITEAVEAVLAAAVKDDACGEVFNVGTGRSTSVRDVVDTLVRLSGRNVDIQWGAVDYRPQEWMALSADTQKAGKYLEFHASIGLDEGLDRILKSY